MSALILTTYSTFDFQTAKINREEKIETPMASIGLSVGLEPPKTGLLALYGFRDALEEIEFQRKRACVNKQHLQLAELVVDVGRIHDEGLVSIEQLRDENMRFVSVRRMAAGLQEHVVRRIAEFAGEGAVCFSSALARWTYLAKRTQFIPDLMADTEFANVDVIVFPAITQANQRIRFVAWIRPGTAIKEVRQNIGYCHSLSLPKSLQVAA